MPGWVFLHHHGHPPHPCIMSAPQASGPAQQELQAQAQRLENLQVFALSVVQQLCALAAASAGGCVIPVWIAWCLRQKALQPFQIMASALGIRGWLTFCRHR